MPYKVVLQFYSLAKMSYNDFDESYAEEILDEDYDSDAINENGLFNSSDFISKPIKSATCTIDEETVQLQYPLLLIVLLKY